MCGTYVKEEEKSPSTITTLGLSVSRSQPISSVSILDLQSAGSAGAALLMGLFNREHNQQLMSGQNMCGTYVKEEEKSPSTITTLGLSVSRSQPISSVSILDLQSAGSAGASLLMGLSKPRAQSTTVSVTGVCATYVKKKRRAPQAKLHSEF